MPAHNVPRIRARSNLTFYGSSESPAKRFANRVKEPGALDQLKFSWIVNERGRAFCITGKQ